MNVVRCCLSLSYTLLPIVMTRLLLSLDRSLSRFSYLLYAFFYKLRCVVLSVRLSATRSNFPIKPSGQFNTRASIYCAGRSYANWHYGHNVSHTECYWRSFFKLWFLRGCESSWIYGKTLNWIHHWEKGFC